MKKIYFLFLIPVIIAACQQTPETLTVDINAEKDSIYDMFNKFNSAFVTGDVNTLVSFLTDDVVVLGSDPTEQWNKQEITDIWEKMFDADIDYGYNVFGDRIIIVAPGGQSASVMEQFMMPFYSMIMPFRNTYHIVKKNGNWKILFMNTAYVPRNELVQKINGALELL